MAKAYRQPPSVLYGVEEPGSLTAWCFDNAIYTFGSALEAELDKHTGKDAAMKRSRTLAAWLQLPDSMRFRSPMGPTRK